MKHRNGPARLASWTRGRARHLLLVIGLLVLAIGCRNDTLVRAPDGGERRAINLAHEADFPVLDPVMVRDAFGLRIVGQIFEGLLALDESNELVGALAESWSPSEQFDEWVFVLRENVEFHRSGSSSTAARLLHARDVEASLTRSLRGGTSSAFVLLDILEGARAFHTGEADSVSGIRTDGDRRVVFSLMRPESTFPNRLASANLGIMPAELADDSELSEPIGTGPYRYEPGGSDVEMALRRFDGYWGGLVPEAAEILRFRLVRNEQVRLQEFVAGNLDVIRVTPNLALEVFSDSGEVRSRAVGGDARLVVAPSNGVHFVLLNANRLDLDTRRALQSDVDREQIVRRALRGSARGRLGIVPDGLGRYSPIDEGSVPSAPGAWSAERRSLELLTHQLDGADFVAEVLKRQWELAGIDVSLRKLEFNALVERMFGGQFDALMMFFQHVHSDPSQILRGAFHSDNLGGSNIFGLSDSELDRTLDTLARTAAEGLRSSRALEVEQLVFRMAPAVFLYQDQNAFLVKEDLADLRFTIHGLPIFGRGSPSSPSRK